MNQIERRPALPPSRFPASLPPRQERGLPARVFISQRARHISRVEGGGGATPRLFLPFPRVKTSRAAAVVRLLSAFLRRARVLLACRERLPSHRFLFFSLHTHLSTSCVRSRRTVNFALPEAAHTFAPFLPQPVSIPSPPSPCISREKQIFARGQWPRSSPTREQLGSAHWKRAAVVTFREEQLTRPAHLAAGAAAACEALFGSVSRCLGRVSFSFFRLAGVLRSPPPLRGGERRPPASIGVRRGQLRQSSFASPLLSCRFLYAHSRHRPVRPEVGSAP